MSKFFWETQFNQKFDDENGLPPPSARIEETHFEYNRVFIFFLDSSKNSNDIYFEKCPQFQFRDKMGPIWILPAYSLCKRIAILMLDVISRVEVWILDQTFKFVI